MLAFGLGDGFQHGISALRLSAMAKMAPQVLVDATVRRVCADADGQSVIGELTMAQLPAIRVRFAQRSVHARVAYSFSVQSDVGQRLRYAHSAPAICTPLGNSVRARPAQLRQIALADYPSPSGADTALPGMFTLVYLRVSSFVVDRGVVLCARNGHSPIGSRSFQYRD